MASTARCISIDRARQASPSEVRTLFWRGHTSGFDAHNEPQFQNVIFFIEMSNKDAASFRNR